MRLALLRPGAAATFAQIDATKSGRVGAVEVITEERDGVLRATLRNTGSTGIKFGGVTVYPKLVRQRTPMLAVSSGQASPRENGALPHSKVGARKAARPVPTRALEVR